MALAQDEMPPWTVEPLAAVPPAQPAMAAPSMKETAVTLEKAQNGQQVLKYLGLTLSVEQKKFLNANKFLLIPKNATTFKGAFGGACNSAESWDEMLGMFDSLCGSSIIQERKPENVKLVTPDLMLHALHKYFDNTLEYVEVTELSRQLLGFVQTVRAGAMEAGSAAATAEKQSPAAASAPAPVPAATAPAPVPAAAPPVVAAPVGSDNSAATAKHAGEGAPKPQATGDVAATHSVRGTVDPPATDKTGNKSPSASGPGAGTSPTVGPSSGMPASTAGTTERLARGYERLAAQMTVALVLLEDADWANPGGVLIERPEGQSGPEGNTPAPTRRGTVESALQRLRGLEPGFSPQTVQAMRQELQAIHEAKALAASPLRAAYDPTGSLQTDYTQFTPRGHYAKSPALRAYFRAMKFLSLGGYPLSSQDGLSDSLLLMELAARPGPGGAPAQEAWSSIMAVTGFFAGTPDDVGFAELAALVGKTLKKDALTPAESVDPALLDKLAANLSALPSPRIAAPDKGKTFRLFGERFSLDAGILDRLTAGRQDQGLKLPAMPSALFVAAALGMKPARELTSAFLKRAPEGFSQPEVNAFLTRLDQETAKVAALREGQWYSSLASAWLGVLPALRGVYGQGYPAYMQSPAFRLKEVQTLLGSYAELKHDTILYAKQLLAEYGEGSDLEPPPVPKGFVEPNLEFWNRFRRVVRFAKEGLGAVQSLRAEVRKGRIARFDDDTAFLASLAMKEARNTPVSAAEYEKLRTMDLTYMGAPYSSQVFYEDEDRRSGLIADMFTNVKDGRILYEATGEPYVLLALVANENSPRLVIGVAFNHYELTGPLGVRETDQTWQARIYEGHGEAPVKNFWYQGLTPDAK